LIAKDVYKETGFVLFALEIVVGDNINGEILLNPGSQRLPKPSNQGGSQMKYRYFGYIIAPDRDEAENIFSSNGKLAQDRKIKNPLTGKSVYDTEAPNGTNFKLSYDPLANTPAGTNQPGKKLDGDEGQGPVETNDV
jgi:hypothetical protein